MGTRRNDPGYSDYTGGERLQRLGNGRQFSPSGNSARPTGGRAPQKTPKNPDGTRKWKKKKIGGKSSSSVSRNQETRGATRKQEPQRRKKIVPPSSGKYATVRKEHSQQSHAVPNSASSTQSPRIAPRPSQTPVRSDSNTSRSTAPAQHSNGQQTSANSTSTAAVNDRDEKTRRILEKKKAAEQQAQAEKEQAEAISVDKKKSRKKIRIFSRFAGTWVILLVVASASLWCYGYTTWKNAEISKIERASYDDGRESVLTAPDVSNVLKVPEQKIIDLVTTAPGAKFPAHPVISDIKLRGWSIPGGNESKGFADIKMCYTGDGVDKMLTATAYLISDNAHDKTPSWNVDSVALTGNPCK